MSNPNLTAKIEQLMTRMADMQSELASLQAQAGLTAPATEPGPAADNQPVQPTRRKMLRRLAGGMLAGLAVGGVAAAVPQQSVVAKMVTTNGRIGAIVTPKGDQAVNDLADGPFFRYGLVALSGLNLDLYDDPTLYNQHTAVFARSNHTGVYAHGQSYGVYGKGNLYGLYGTSNQIGVYGTSSTGYGVYGKTTSGVGVVAKAETGTPFRIAAGPQPVSVAVKGDMYVDDSGNLRIYNGSLWKVVLTS